MGMTEPAAVLVPMFLLACSSSSAVTVDDSDRLTSLSMAELQSFCDWLAQQEGGYGHVTTCDSGASAGVPIMASSSQSMCESDFSQVAARAACTETVGQWKACFTSAIQSQCSSTPSPLPAECGQLQQDCYGDSLMDGG
jgi:hypothetical protein